MKFEQHIYTSGKTEFMTVAMTGGISREEQLQLESFSIYFLPIALHYQEQVTAPVKYIWYALGETRFVVGRGVYTGKDSLGRTGNYLFHNLILSKDDLIASCYVHPARLIKTLEAQGVFVEQIPTQPLTPIEFATDDIIPPASGPHYLPDDLLLLILSACIEYRTAHHPFLLVGSPAACLDFLDQVYTVLPFHIRLALRVDTYAYGVSSVGFHIIGVQDAPEYQQAFAAAVTLQLANLRYTAQTASPPPSAYIGFIADMTSANRIRELNEVYALEYDVRTENYAWFLREYPRVAEELQHVVWIFHTRELLKRIVTASDTELLPLVRKRLRIDDLHTLYAAPEMLNRLIETGDPDNVNLVAEWLCTPGSKTLFYPYLFASQALWNTLLQHIHAHPQNAAFLLELLRAFSGYYSAEFEKTLHEHLIPLLPMITGEKEGGLFREMLLRLPALTEGQVFVKELFKAFDALPPSGSERMDILRTFVTYRLSNAFECIERLLESPIAALPEEYQPLVFDAIANRILVMRTFEIWSTDKASQQVRKLFEHAFDSPPALHNLVCSIEKLHLTNDAKKAMKIVWKSLQEKFSNHPNIPPIRQRMEHVCKSSSWLETMRNLLKEE